MPYSFGADPELFVFNTKTNKFVSSHDLVLGTKEDPFPVEYGAVQVDGVAAEFNIDPAGTFKEFNRNIKAVKKQLLEMVQKHNKDLILVAKPTATFDQGYFDALPPETKVLGCDPDYCGYTGLANLRPDPGNRPFRTGGGHVHIGWGSGFSPADAGHFADCRVLAKALYGSGLSFDRWWDDDTSRRQLYGSAYSFRAKSFGMEYRYLSNAWVDNDDAMKFVFDVCKKTLETLDTLSSKSPGYCYPEISLPKKFQTIAREEGYSSPFQGYFSTSLER